MLSIQSISAFHDNHIWMICGDTLFTAGCGRVFEGIAYEESILSGKRISNDHCSNSDHKNSLRFVQNRQNEHTATNRDIIKSMGYKKKVD